MKTLTITIQRSVNASYTSANATAQRLVNRYIRFNGLKYAELVGILHSIDDGESQYFYDVH